MHTRRNRVLAYAGALIGLLAILTVRQRTRPVAFEDYSVYYLGGTIVLQDAWSDLYPVPIPNATSHPGWPAGSQMKPAYRQAAERVGETNPYRYVYPPPSAVFVAPLAALPPQLALLVWWALSAVACWVSALCAAALYRQLTGRRDLAWTLLLFGIAWCPLTWATVRVGNTSAISGAMVSIVIVGWCMRSNAAAAVGFYLGGALKFITLPLALIPVLLRRTHAVVVCAVVAMFLTAAVVALSGIDPWLEYVRLLGWLNRPNDWVINLSLHGLIDAVVPAARAPRMAALVQWSTWIALGAIVVGLHRCAWRRDDPRPVLAGATALLAWLLIFEPTAQNHYYVCLYPLWGYLVAESRESRPALFVAVCVIAGTMIPIGGSNRAVPLWLHFHQLGAAIIAMVFGAVRLYQLGAHDERALVGDQQHMPSDSAMSSELLAPGAAGVAS